MRTKFFLFHFAGGSRFSYDYLQNIPDIDIIPLELPGRGKRVKESFHIDLNDAVNDYFDKVIKYSNGEDYIIYGHSMGALLAYLVCHKIQESNLLLPSKLIVSGKKSPSILSEEKISQLSDDEFLKNVYGLGGIPDETKKYPELINFFLPILKNDFKLIESYAYKKKDKLNVPIDVFFGSDEAQYFEMKDWIDESSKEVNLIKLDGNHFFIYDHKDYFKDYFKKLNQESYKKENIF